MKHKHYEMIVAWADGAEIEVKVNGGWDKVKTPSWFEDTKYRIKPAPRPQWQQDLIDAAKAGKVVEFRPLSGDWERCIVSDYLYEWEFCFSTRECYRIRPEKVTRYLWAIKDFAGEWCTTNVFRTEQEAAVSYTALEYTKLDWSATEFED